MNVRKPFTFILIFLMVLSLNISSQTGVTATSPGERASITDLSMTDAGASKTDRSDQLGLDNERIDPYRVKSIDDATTVLDRDLRTKLDESFLNQGVNRYEKTAQEAKYDPTVRKLNNIILNFDSFSSRDNFVASIPQSSIVSEYKSLPYLVVKKTPEMYSSLLLSEGLEAIVDDVIFETPEFNVEVKEELDNSEFFNSEGRIGAWDLHDMGYTGKNVKVAVLDTGIDVTHPDLLYTNDGSPKILDSVSFVPGEGPEDYIGHGTHVAGTVAGNGYHIGVAPDANLINAKVCSFVGCATSWMFDAVDWAIQQQVDIITMSIGGSTLFGTDILDEIIDYAWQEGIVLTIAAGNAGPSVSTVQSPGTGPRVITAGATDNYDLITGFSGRGPSVYGHFDPDLSAPGQGIFSTLPGGTYGIYSGTSMATPHIAGAVALMMDAHPWANPDTIKTNMIDNAKDLGLPANVQGAGMVDLVTTQERWNWREDVVFPVLNENDVFYLSPGESYSGYLDYITGVRFHPVPKFYVDSNDDFDIDIEKHALRNNIRGHQFVPFTITVPTDAVEGEMYTRELYASVRTPWRGHFFHFKHGFDKLLINVEVVTPENDASSSTDAGDTFVGAMEVPFAPLSAYAKDLDFYKVYLSAGQTYSIILDGMTGQSDFDLGVYDENGVLSCDVCYIFAGGTTPEIIEVTPETSGYFYIRVDPWSLLYIDPYARIDTSGPYELIMVEGSVTGQDPGEEPAGTSIEFIEAQMYGIDEDADTVNDYLAVDITLDVLSTGLLDVYAFLATDRGEPLNKWVYATPFAENIELTETGIQTLTLILDGTYVADQNFVGSHVLYELFMGDPSTFTILEDLFNVYTSPELDSSAFGPSHMTYQSMTSAPVDVDLDGTNDYLSVSMTMSIDTTFDDFAYFYATLYHPDNYFFYSLNEVFVDLSVSGEVVLEFIFDPRDFVNADTGLMDLELVITYSFEHPLQISTEHFGIFPYIITIGETFSVDLSDFATGSGGDNVITSIVDYGVDTDLDDTYDYLVLEVTVSLSDPGYYALSYHPWVWSIKDQEVLFDFSSNPYQNIQWFDAGETTMYLVMNGELINSLEIDGPFLFLFIWLDTFEEYEWGFDYTGTADEYQNYLTSGGQDIDSLSIDLNHNNHHDDDDGDDNDELTGYEWDDFDIAGAKYLGISATNYVDLDGDGEAETVEVQLEFDIGYPGDFYIYGVLFDYPLGSFYFNYVESFEYFDTAGIHTVSFYLQGRDFYISEFEEYLEFWELHVINANTGMETYFDFQNGIFEVDYQQLPGAAPYGSIGDISDYGIDTNDNGLFEYLAVDVTIDVTTPSFFSLYMDVFGGASSGYWDYVGFYYNFFYADQPGEYVVTLLIPAGDILANVNDPATDFELWLFLVDDLGIADQVGPVYTDWYELSQFERAAFISSITDSGLDANANGLYEGIEVEFTIEVSTPGDYYIDMEVYSGETFEWIGYFYTYFYAPDPGTYVTSIVIAASAIISRTSVDYTNFELWIYLSNYNGLVDMVPAYYTDYYYISDFETAASIVGISDYANDVDGNGLYEFLNFEISIDVGIPGLYTFDLSVFGNDDAGYSDFVAGFYGSFFFSDTGLQTVLLELPAFLILERLTDDYTDFELWLLLGDSNGQEIDFLGPVYTAYYYKSDFELVVSVLGSTTYGEDLDSNGLFESIIIEVTVEVYKPGDYVLLTDLYGDADSNFIYVGYYETTFSAPSAGIYTLYLVVPGTDILSSDLSPETNFFYWAVITDTNYRLYLFSGPYYTDYYSLASFE